MGEVFADFFGLTQSKFQWAIDAKKREDEEAERRRRRRMRERQLAERRREEAVAARDAALERGSDVAADGEATKGE